MKRLRLSTVLILTASFILFCSTAGLAAPGTIVSFTTTSSGNITFAATDLSNAAQPGSQAYAYALSIITSPLPGSVTITAPTITGTFGNSIAQSAFLASCVATLDPGGIFTSSGMVRLSSGPVTCGTVAANANNLINFSVTLYLDNTPDASSFTADSYANGTLTVTANAP